MQSILLSRAAPSVISQRACNRASRSSSSSTVRPRRARYVSGLRVSAEATGDSVQMATAKLPRDLDVVKFGSSLFQWASGITSIGQDPFILPQKVDKTATGFRMAFLMQTPSGQFDSIGAIEASVETPADAGGAAVLFVRGTGKVASNSLPDVPRVMEKMPTAIRQAVADARGGGSS